MYLCMPAGSNGKTSSQVLSGFHSQQLTLLDKCTKKAQPPLERAYRQANRDTFIHPIVWILFLDRYILNFNYESEKNEGPKWSW